MAKLKFDRSINLDLKSNNKMTVPKDEVWKVTIGVDTREKNASLYINDALAYDGFNVRENGASYLNVTLGGVLKSTENSVLQGLCSRLLNNIPAKVVSLA